MKWVLIVVGALLLLVGAVWVLQGVNILQRSQMSGHLQWTAIGGVLAVVGVVLLVVGATRRRVKPA